MVTNLLSEFEIQFWGVRGSIPSPGAQTIRYGGNTSCVEMRVGEKRLIFDGGTGLRGLGKSLRPKMDSCAHLFFTHYHWDHIQGVPFFLPEFSEDNYFYIYGQVPPEEVGLKMKQHFSEHVLHLDSPVPVKEIKAQLKFHDLVCQEQFDLDDIVINTCPLNHPNGAMGYRIDWGGHAAVYCTDTEHFPDHLDENILQLAQGADILIYDAMYTDAEYHDSKSPKIGWGHSTWQEGVKLAKAAGVKKLAIFHHEPNHTDDFLDQVGIEVKESFEQGFMAKEGLVVSVMD